MRKNEILFFVKFFLIFGIGSYVIPFLPLQQVQFFVAGLTGGWLGLTVLGNVIPIHGIDFIVNEYCTGSMSSLILLAIIFSLTVPLIQS